MGWKENCGVKKEIIMPLWANDNAEVCTVARFRGGHWQVETRICRAAGGLIVSPKSGKLLVHFIIMLIDVQN